MSALDLREPLAVVAVVLVAVCVAEKEGRRIRNEII